MIKAKKLFSTWCPKSAVPPRTQNFWFFFFHRGFLKKILHKIPNFEVWVAWRFFEQMAKKLIETDRRTDMQIDRQTSRVVLNAAFSPSFTFITLGIQWDVPDPWLDEGPGQHDRSSIWRSYRGTNMGKSIRVTVPLYILY